jgi:hypothetical protein
MADAAVAEFGRLDVLVSNADISKIRPMAYLDVDGWQAKKYGLWRVAEDDSDSDLYAESSDADTVIGYVTEHPETRRTTRPAPGAEWSLE